MLDLVWKRGKREAGHGPGGRPETCNLCAASCAAALPKKQPSMRKLKREEMARPSTAQLEALPKHPVTAVLEDIRSLYNVGSMFRTADAARIEELVLTGITGTPEHRKLRKSSLGAEETVAWRHEERALPALRRLRAGGYTLAALEISSDPFSFAEVSLEHFPLCLLIGNELEGVSEEAMGVADLALEIPQFGRKQSLNVAVAFGIAVFELVQRYRRLAGLPERFEKLGG